MSSVVGEGGNDHSHSRMATVPEGLTLRRTQPRATSLHLTREGVAALVHYCRLPPPMSRPSVHDARQWAAILRRRMPFGDDVPTDVRTSAEELVAFFDDNDIVAETCSDEEESER